MRWTIVAAATLLICGSAWAQDVDVKKLYDKKCKLCHSLGGVKGKKADKGGPLDGVGAQRDEAWLRAYFKEPKSKIDGAKMPKIKLTDAEWDAMVAYMLSLTEPAPDAGDK